MRDKIRNILDQVEKGSLPTLVATEKIMLLMKESNYSEVYETIERSSLWDLIRKRSDEDINFSNKITALEQINGEELFVKNLENIQGDQRDIIIISTTFGKREDGNFLQNYGPINQHKGFRLLNVIITRAKHKVFVFTSIPES